MIRTPACRATPVPVRKSLASLASTEVPVTRAVRPYGFCGNSARVCPVDGGRRWQVTLFALALAVTAVSSAPARVTPARPPRVEVTFVLDTTGSMGGLIEGAKRRIWSIARRIGEGRPRPDLRIALVGYRDLGDEYVTRVHDLSGDMDEVYQNLSAFRADGGGDTPEHVSRALHDAVHRVSWSQGPGLRVIFLVGDAPPHVDYQDGFDYHRHVAEARQRGVVVETILCGRDVQAAAVWQEIASLGQGHYAQIDGQGGMPAAVQARIQTLQKQREGYLRAQPGATTDAFDEKVVQNLRNLANNR